jgi:sulfatase modifying factor 1
MIIRHITAFLAAGAMALAMAGGRVPSSMGSTERIDLTADAYCATPPEYGTIFDHALQLDPKPAVSRSRPDPQAQQVDSVCPDDMVQAAGEYCTEVKHDCVEWLDDRNLPFARCARYAKTSTCVGRRVPMNFCIDRFEYTRPGETLPENHMSFAKGQQLCRSLGKRLCTESEWNFACEGEELRPYPYGWVREAKCNQDRDDLFERKLVDGKFRQVLKDHREPSREDTECVSPFGVANLVGNLDEPVLREATRFSPPFRNALKGGWWMAARNRCRPATTAHDDFYEDVQVGVRCCADVPGDSAPTG